MNIQLLQASYARIESQKEKFAISFYTTLLEKYPAFLPFFAGVDLKRQQTSLIAMLLVMLKQAEREENVRRMFQKLGQHHATRQIRAEHYPAFGQTLMDTLALYDPQWNNELRLAWATALDRCVRFMMESYPPEATIYRVQITTRSSASGNWRTVSGQPHAISPPQ